jgi:hypothetical protein
MKKSLPIFIFVLLFSLSIKAQESTTFSNTDNSSEITKTSFFEWNFGVAFLSYDSLIPFPRMLEMLSSWQKCQTLFHEIK